MDKNGGTPPCRVFLRKSLAVPGDELNTVRSMKSPTDLLVLSKLGDIGGGVSKEPQRHSSKRLTLSLFNHSWPKNHPTQQHATTQQHLPTTFQELLVFPSSDFKTKELWSRAAETLFLLQLHVCRRPRSFIQWIIHCQKTLPPNSKPQQQ